MKQLSLASTLEGPARANKRRSSPLLFCGFVSLLAPSLASADVTISITSPTPGQPVLNPVTITTTYSSSGPPLDLASFRAFVNGVDWTSRFTVEAGSATYVVAPQDTLIAGPLTIRTEIRDSASPPAAGEATESYDVLPSLQAVAPSTAAEGTPLTMGVLGLDPDPTRNLVVFSSIFGGEAVEPFATVDRSQNQGMAPVPDGARTGSMQVRVNGRTSPQSLQVTVLPGYLECGPIDRFLSLPDGSFVILYLSLFSPPPAGCPSITPAPGFNPVAVRLHADRTTTVLATSDASGRVEEIAVDKSGQYPAVLVGGNVGGNNGLLIQYRGTTTSFALSGGLFTLHRVDADFDVNGDLYIALLDPRTHLLRIPAAALVAGGLVVPEVVADALDVRNTPGCADWLSLAVSCDGHAHVAIQNHLNLSHPPGVCPADEWTRWNQGIIRKIDLVTGAVVSDVYTDNGTMYDIALTCQSDEILGVTLTNYNYPVPGDVWRSVDGGGPSPVFTIPLFSPKALTIGPSGKVYINNWEYQSPRRYLVAIPYRVGGCGGTPSVFQPYCLSPLLYPVRILPAETTRWKPQRDTTTPIVVNFDGPTDLTPATVLEIKDPDGNLVPDPSLTFEEVPPDTEPQQYRITWSGPWTRPDGTPLPAGNYTVIVRGRRQDGSPADSGPYSRISLVEVKRIELKDCTSVPGASCGESGARLEANTGVGGGRAALPDARLPGGPFERSLFVRAELEPSLGDDSNQVTVYFKAVDVDDPSANTGPIDDDSLPPNPIDNRNENMTLTPSNTAGRDLGRGPTRAIGLFKVSTQQGNNYRLAASTHQPWLDGIYNVVPSQTGAIIHASGESLTEGAQTSEMLTVWRTLHLELSRFDPSPRTQMDLQHNGTWTSLARRELVDASAPFFGITIDGLLDHTTANGWKGADVNPASSGGDDFRLDSNNDRRLSTRVGDMCSVVPAGFCNKPPPSPADRSYYLRDDKLSSLGSTVHDVSLLTSILQSAYIRLEAIEGPDLPWQRNLTSVNQRTLPGTVANSISHWSVLFLLSFDGDLVQDYDPTDEGSSSPRPPVTGRCDPPIQQGADVFACGLGNNGTMQPVATAFLETIHDYLDTGSSTCIRPTIPFTEFYRGTTAHEVLHAMSLGHDGDATGGIMCSAIRIFASQPGRNDITTSQRARLRNLMQPGVFPGVTDLPGCSSLSCP
jgi:hypothetical protein